MGLKRVLRNWLLNDGCDQNKPVSPQGYYGDPKIECSNSSASPDADAILNFRVFQAVGHHIVEFQRYDRHNDRRNTTLYSIAHDEDFGEKIAKISQTEILKN